MSKTKLEKVLEHLLNNQEGQAKALLHQIFIEKARAIHEDLMTQEEEDLSVGGTGDDEDDFLSGVKSHSDDIEDDEDEIEFEEIMSEDDDAEVSDSDDMDDMVDGDVADIDAGDEEGMEHETGEMQGMEQGIDALSKALEELQAEFDRLQGHDAGEEEDQEHGELVDMGDEGDDDHDVMDAGEEGDVEEDWLHEDQWDDLAENVNLDTVTTDMLSSQKTPGEVGSGKFASDVGRSAKSPVPASQKERMGAKPVETGKGATASGFERQSAPSSATLKHTQGDNRRSKSTQGMSEVSKEGASGALLNKSTEGNKKSPLSRAPEK